MRNVDVFEFNFVVLHVNWPVVANRINNTLQTPNPCFHGLASNTMHGGGDLARAGILLFHDLNSMPPGEGIPAHTVSEQINCIDG